jgi:hypothetical protein
MGWRSCSLMYTMVSALGGVKQYALLHQLCCGASAPIKRIRKQSVHNFLVLPTKVALRLEIKLHGVKDHIHGFVAKVG